MRRSTESTRSAPPFPLRSDTLGALFEAAVKRWGGRVAMKRRCGESLETILYDEFGSLVSRLGTGLIARGLAAGDRVALLSENGPAWGLVYAAATSCGAAIVPLDTQLGGNEIRRLLAHCGAKFLFASRSLLDERLEQGSLGEARLIVIGERNGIPGSSALENLLAEGGALAAGEPGAFEEHAARVRPDDVAAICYTSGTTGQPKGVVLSNRNLVSNVEACRRRVPFLETDTFLSILPLYHTYATTCNLLAPLSTGAAILFGRSLKSKEIREDIEREGVTVICGVPLLFERMARSIEKSLEERPAGARLLFSMAAPAVAALSRLTGRNVARSLFRAKLEASGLGSLRFCVSGAAALKDDIDRTLWSVGIPILQGYGMTEASPVISVNPLERPCRGTIGPPLPGVEVRIGEPNGEGTGEILVRGPNVMREYLENAEATADVLRDGWLHTGDLGRLDRRGYITFVGRKKSVIVTAGGKNVYPDELESILNGGWCILESVVLPTTDRKGNDQVAAIVVPDYEALSASRASAGNLTDERVRELVTAEVRSVCTGLPEYKRIREIRIRNEELPKTSTRKVKRHLVAWTKE
jgi:long-chain acyl-CoA synthetase